MFSIGFFEIFVLLCLALVFMGPQALLDLIKEVAKIFHQLRAIRDDVNQKIQHKNNQDS